MFVIGLEFSLSKLRAMKRHVFGLGLTQVVLTLLLTTLGSLLLTWLLPTWWNISWRTAVALGGVMAMSSTAIVIGYAMPAFLFAMFLIVVFAGGTSLNWFPVRGLVSENFDELSTVGKVADYFWHLVLPVTALVIGGFATLTILTKNSFLNEITRQYVVTARAKGLSEKVVIVKHTLRNALIPVITMMGLQFGFLLGGSIVVETVFGWPGMGTLLVDAVTARDYPIIQGLVLLFSFEFILINLIVDVLYGVINPTIRYK